MEKNIEKLKDLNTRLTRLLADPQWGLGTWLLAVAKTVTEMAEIIGVARKD